ncbi:hypothetical protein JVX90_13265 [Gordonia sp. PDNC005]|uniref:hypothetical protein n=1 Tax=unclassified Gordonia (in: high G+C Gram-positive bacteria) TaxID=2657482 RepID=UPI00196534F4|nr:hypothetical protein [Gordonia sp. PDNC005]QRY61386.1 hypothetical protein JVX90_13265 [Gordonia sp. PDNC005]
MADPNIHHENHGNHPMSLLAFVLLLAGGALSALWIVTLADLPAGRTMNITYGVLALGCLVSSALIFRHLTTHLHHSPVMPDNTQSEIDRYLGKVR